ncbi:thioredoxin domain-containing protein [Zafaria sp. Z1313]|uniref:thioredoxin domain-containing protein n=1 Tax=unclassified Zafaria TaxID=2828765 RepID=UPI002E76B81E|nr:DUF255 domain-containing protein [Zafaria sp. J156]MEE1619927.1 DUF255 domain-containing protein [Zafaria sp. J156]
MAGHIDAEASAYLRQHAHQPVDWWPYGDAAFEEAARRDVPVFLSIGYAACHWCHVMARESFDDPATAAYLNARFVPVKVDREERPEVDAVYLAATQTLSGQGGWPMSVFALPDGRAFHAGTYFPPVPRQGQPSFGQVLEAVAEAWRDRREGIERQAGALAEHLGALADAQRGLLAPPSGTAREDPAATAPPPGTSGAGAGAAPSGPFPGLRGGGPRGPDLASLALDALEALRDPDGGFSPAPKFPPSSALDFLLQEAAGGTHAGRALDLAGTVLEPMLLGALQDHVGGGFSRYCIDGPWLLPHFEKMLYDNAQLLRHAARWSRLAGDAPRRELGRRAATGAAEWMLAELEAGGLLASSLDADTVLADGSHVEGGAYLFSRLQLRDAAGEDWSLLGPILRGRSPERPHGPDPDPGEPATIAFVRLPDDAEWAAWDRVRPRLLAARARRPQPARDAKAVASWNGLAVQALAEAGLLLGRRDWVVAAAGIGGALWRRQWDGRRVMRVGYPGGAPARIDGTLEDHAGVALGFLALAAAEGDAVWLERARTVLDAAERDLVPDGSPRDGSGGDGRLLAARGGRAAVEPLDDAVPSGTALFAAAQLSLGAYDADARRLELASALAAAPDRLAGRAPQAVGTALAVRARLGAGPATVVASGGSPAERDACLAAAVLAGAAAWAGGAPGGGVPVLARDRPAGPDGGLRAYACFGSVCEAPVAGPGAAGELARLLAARAAR